MLNRKTFFPLLLIGLFMSNREYNKLKPQSMHLNAGIITSRLLESKKFYMDVLHFEVKFENEWYLLMNAPGGLDHVSFMLPDHPSQQPIFKPAFQGQGVFFTIEVENLDVEYKRIKEAGVPIIVTIRDEPWGERHFSIVDPNGIGVDMVGSKR